MITSRKRRPLDRDKVAFRDSKLIIIATEGALTEPRYFGFLKTTRVQIAILPTENGESAPRAVLERLKKFQADYQLGNEDELFVVVDKDRWPDRQLSEVAQACADNYVLAVSNPCFELWLLLHFADAPAGGIECRDLENVIRAKNGEYNKRNLKSEWFTLEKVKQAVERSRRLDSVPSDRWPQTTGTRVYKILESIIPFLDGIEVE